MTEMTLRQYLQINGGIASQGVRAICGTGDISLRELLSSLHGWVDMHAHPMAHLAFGGKLIHGGPDVGSLLPADSQCQKNVRAKSMEHALCDDRSTHAGWGPFNNSCGDDIRQAVIDALQKENKAYETPDGARGAPDFPDWPRWNDITHQKMWIDWIQRAHSGGLRVMVALAVHNQTLAAAISGDGDGPLDDKASGDLQINEIKAFVGRHLDFMEVAYSPTDLRRIVQANKIGIVLGVELDAFGNFHKGTDPTLTMVKDELIRLHAMGVRYIFPIHVIDNQLGGTAVYDGGFNTSNYREYGDFWSLEKSQPEDKITYKYTPSGFDLAVAAVKAVKLGIIDPFRNPPTPPQCDSLTGHMNTKSLTPLGESAIKEMMKLGLMIDIDHMSQKSANRALDLAREAVEQGGYPLNCGHNGARSAAKTPNENSRTNEQLQRIADLGGMLGHGIAELTPTEFIHAYQVARKEMRNRSIGLGTDFNGLTKGLPEVPGLIYNSEFTRCTTGTKTWDYHNDGVAHYGMLPDFLRAVMACSDGKIVNSALNRSAHTFVQMWERCEARKSKVK